MSVFIRILLLLAISGPALAVAEELSSEKRADIVRLIEVTKVSALASQMASTSAAQIAQLLRQTRPDIPQKVLDTLPGIFVTLFDERLPSLIEEIVPIYHRHFSASEIKGMLAFYSTPLGQKTIQVAPMLLSESVAVGQRWGRSLGPEIDRRIRERFKSKGITLES